MTGSADTNHRCGGHCCELFDLPYGPDELWGRAPGIRDGGQIADMVEYQGYFPPGESPVAHAFLHTASKGGHYYRCTNVTPDGLCSIYADRPSMCRGYPYPSMGQRCNYQGCAASCAILQAGATRTADRRRARTRLQRLWAAAVASAPLVKVT